MDATKPFDAAAFADVIVRSSDNVDFFVLQSLLRLVSPVFNDMFSPNRRGAASTDENEIKNGLPVIPLSEDSETLYFLFTLIYPYIHEPNLDNGHLLLKVGKVAQKYRMDIIERKLRVPISKHGQFLFPDQFHLYVTAAQLGWHSEAARAVRHTLSTPLHRLPYVAELRSISGADFYRYFDYRLRCEASPFEGFGEKFDPNPPPAHGARDDGQQQPSADTVITPVNAAKPFDPSAKADLILRSSDFVDFFVLEGLLGFVSPVIDKLEKIVEMNGLPVIVVEEDSLTLHQLLLLIYPNAEECQIDDIDGYLKTGRAIQKYRMYALEKPLTTRLMASKLIENEPLRVYSIAIALRWDQVAKLAAKSTLDEPLENMTFVEELALITGADLYHLVQYRFRCTEAACEVIEKNILLANQKREAGSEKHLISNRIIAKLKDRPRGKSVVEACVRESEELEKGRNWGLEFVAKLLHRRDGLVFIVEEIVSKVLFFFIVTPSLLPVRCP
ncbi:hypothetical protein AX17_002199 [Amanita inopinata Kibby_2008]|nr:hypothetical protein AX17_002199 [Amanita inopinata Kibby_2008]